MLTCLSIIGFNLVKGSVNPEIVKNIACCYFLIITVMYIKVYISGMEMSLRILLISDFTKNADFWENGKKSIFWLKKLWQAKTK